MNRLLLITAILAAVSIPARCHGGIINANATVSAVADGANFDYTIHLTNFATSTDSIQTFWYAWVPGKDFLPTSPISVTPPAGWTDLITHVPNVPTNGYAIQFKTSSSPFTPGNSLDFKFTSADTPTQIAGISPFYPGTAVGVSVLYQGQPFQGDSLTFTVQSVPEPSSLAMGILGALGSLGGWSLQRRRKARACLITID